jgi:cardiolipin synthase
MLARFSLFFLLLLCNLVIADITVFTSPDSSSAALSSFLEGSKDLKIASYTFTSPWITDELLSLGANITILVEKSPVGGLIGEEILCELQKHGVSVMLYNGHCRFMHAKYIIKDEESVLVSTENLGESGFPELNNHGNRGWGAIAEDIAAASEFSNIFYADLADSEQFICQLDDYEIKYKVENGNYKPVFDVHFYSAQAIQVISAPDAVDEIMDLINSAEKSICVEQFYIYRYWDRQEKSPNLFLEALINKARQGIEVKILLDSYWYNIDEDDIASNLYTNQYVNEIAEKENLSLESKLVNLSLLNLEKIHTKGMVIDDEKVLISSINWNENSPRNNREVGIVVSGESAGYFKDVFMYDWNGETGFVADETILSIFIIMIIILIVLIAWRKFA